jgi:hypothetical protein
MDDKITVAVISAMFGFSLPYLVSVWDRSRRAHRIISALNRELSEVNIEMKEKLERIVEFEGIRLYLGEREEFAVPRMYWKAKYTEIVEAIKDEYFSEFYVMYRLVDRFEQKFREMKLTFETSLGKKDAMALACFGDLITIGEDLRIRLKAGQAGARILALRGLIERMRTTPESDLASARKRQRELER